MGALGFTVPSGIVVGISIVIGLIMVIVFGYTSDQKAIHVAKDRLKAHLLAQGIRTPVAIAGKLSDPDDAERVLANGSAEDFIRDQVWFCKNRHSAGEKTAVIVHWIEPAVGD